MSGPSSSTDHPSSRSTAPAMSTGSPCSSPGGAVTTTVPRGRPGRRWSMAASSRDTISEARCSCATVSSPSTQRSPMPAMAGATTRASTSRASSPWVCRRVTTSVAVRSSPAMSAASRRSAERPQLPPAPPHRRRRRLVALGGRRRRRRRCRACTGPGPAPPAGAPRGPSGTRSGSARRAAGRPPGDRCGRPWRRHRTDRAIRDERGRNVGGRGVRTRGRRGRPDGAASPCAPPPEARGRHPRGSWARTLEPTSLSTAPLCPITMPFWESRSTMISTRM